jgi:hypothetical protein
MKKRRIKSKKKDVDHSIIVVPSSIEYAEQIDRVTAETYQVPLEDSYTPECIIEQIQTFPEGHFTALDTQTDRVVGYTIGMRFDFDPTQPLTATWDETTDYG